MIEAFTSQHKNHNKPNPVNDWESVGVGAMMGGLSGDGIQDNQLKNPALRPALLILRGPANGS